MSDEAFDARMEEAYRQARVGMPSQSAFVFTSVRAFTQPTPLKLLTVEPLRNAKRKKNKSFPGAIFLH